MEHDRKLEGACVTLSKVNCGMGKCYVGGGGRSYANIDRRVSDQKPKKFRLKVSCLRHLVATTRPTRCSSRCTAYRFSTRIRLRVRVTADHGVYRCTTLVL